MYFKTLCFDLDIFAKRLGLFHNGKEKIGSYFGISLTLIYIIISLTIFIYYTISTIRRDELQVHDSTEYSIGAPYINLNNSNLLYFAFGVENAVNASRFVDETIYTARAIYYYGEKNTEGTFVTKEYRDLKIEKCKVKKFGEEYQHLFSPGEFDDSYCVENFDIALTGGFIYDKYSCIRIQIYPCVNKSENNYHCKPQEEIDKVLAGGYFSLLLKDIGLNPTNYTNPILPTIQDFYTTISKDFFRDVIFNYEITEVVTDSGLFYENKNKEKFIKFDRIKESFYLRDDKSYYYKGKNICKVEIRLSDNIHVQRRSYKKMSSVFSTTGGYMQLLYTVFMLLSIIPNQFAFKKIIVNNLLNIEFSTSKKIVRQFYNNQPNSLFLRHSKIEQKKKMSGFNENNKIRNEEICKKISFTNNNTKENSSNLYMKNMHLINKKEEKNEENLSLDKEKEKNISFIEQYNNISKIEMMPQNMELNFMNIKKGSKIKFNLFDYYLGKCFNKSKKVDLFDKGCLLYTDEMDIIHIFKHLLDMEKSLKEKNNITENMKLFLKQTFN